MNASHRAPLALALLAGALLLAACGRNDPAPAAGDAARPGAATHEPQTMIGKAARKGIDKAREEILAGNISLSNGIHVTGPNFRFGDGEQDLSRPNAELTPQGELLIDGKKIAADASQQALLKRYRGQIEQLALAGLEIGAQSADLAGKAMGEAVAGIFRGDEAGIEQRMEAEAGGVKAAAKKLCEQLPGMFETQQALAASLPAFAPYATMEQKDIDECYREDQSVADRTRNAVRDQVRSEVRDGVREGIRGAVQAVAGAHAGSDVNAEAAAEAEAEGAAASAEAKR